MMIGQCDWCHEPVHHQADDWGVMGKSPKVMHHVCWCCSQLTYVQKAPVVGYVTITEDPLKEIPLEDWREDRGKPGYIYMSEDRARAWIEN